MIAVNYLAAAALFCLGLYTVLTRRNLIKMVMGLSLMESSTYLLFISMAYRARSTAPVLINPPKGQSPTQLASGNVADPVLQNFCLTAIVIGVAVTAVFLSVVVRIAQHRRTLIAGFGTKAGLVPFHGWLADAHTAAPGPVSALFSGLMVNLGLVGIARVSLQIYAAGHTLVLGALMVLGIASALIGACMALVQDDLKRLLAYDTVSQVGVMTVGLATADPSGVAGGVYHLINHALFKTLLFLCAGAIVHRTGHTKLSEMGGLARSWPGLAAAFGVGVASIAGVPPFNGYVSLGLIHSGLRDSGQYVPYALLLVAQVITIAALGRAAWLAFLKPRSESYEQRQHLRPGMQISLGTLAACCVVFGVVPGYVLDNVADPAASALLGSGQYIAAVLNQGGSVTQLRTDFAYADPQELAIALLSVVAGALLAWYMLRRKIPRVLELLRAAHTGSVNDYTGYAVGGIIAVVAAFML